MKKTIQTLMSVTLLAFCLVITAQAQIIATADDASDRTVGVAADNSPIGILSAGTPVSDSWVKEVDRQYAKWLKENDGPRRGQALQEINVIAKQYGDTVTFTKAVTSLLNVYIFDDNKSHRLMALSALHAIGDTYGMQRLRELVKDEPSEQVRRLTHRALADYYTRKN